jgi:hypothetical protein
MKKLIALSAVVTLTVGCVNVPPTKIGIPMPDGRMLTISAPKDTDIEGLEVDLNSGILKLKKYKARMNPDVLAATAAGQAELMNSYNNLFQTAFQMGQQAALASAGVPVKK